ncbi:MAG: hypothetical protein K6G08_07190 [Prevotella sp.]|nr:hypothetical protein [Prevotella sp.]
MASKIQGRSFDVPITEYTFEGHKYNSLTMYVNFDSYPFGGGNFYVMMTPELIEVTSGFITHSSFVTGCHDPLGSSKEIKLMNAPRNSRKTIDAIVDALEQAKDDIAWLFNNRMWPKLYMFVSSVGMNGYTESNKQFVKQLRNETTNNDSTTNNNEAMANNAKGADLIGKTIIVGDGFAKFIIKGVEGDNLITDYIINNGEPKEIPVPMTQLETMQAQGVWKIKGNEELRMKNEESADAKGNEEQENEELIMKNEESAGANEEPTPTEETTAEEPTATEEVEEVIDEPEPAPARPQVKTEMPKDKAEEKATKSKPQKPQTKAKSDTSHQTSAIRHLKYEPYTSKKGKACARIVGFNEGAMTPQEAMSLHASFSYTKDGDKKTWMLTFGSRYAEAAKDVCDALNAGKTLADAQAIIDATTEERAKKREEWKQKNEERRMKNEESAGANGEKVYTAKEVAALFDAVIHGAEIPEEISKFMAA